jgi:hypothetical protein
MTVNLKAVTATISVNNGTNDLDISNALVSYGFESEAIDDSGLHRLKGTIELHGYVAGYAESFDCRTNPNRWKPGNAVSFELNIGGTDYAIPQLLKILKYPSRPTPQNPNITLEVGGDLSLYDYRQPEGDSGESDDYGTSRNRTAILSAILAKNSLTLGTGQALTAYPLTYPAQKNDGDSWVSFAGKVARSVNAMLWQDAAGDVNITAVTLDSLTALNHYTVGTNEGDFELQSFEFLPPETIRVTGTGYTLTAKNNDSIQTVNTVDTVTVTTNYTFSGQGTNNPSKTVEVRKPANIVQPDKTTSTTEITDTQTTTEDTYSLSDGKLDQTVITVEEPRSKVLPGSYTSNLIDTQETTIEYFYDADDVVKERRSTIRVNNSNAVLVDYQTIVETWVKKGDIYNYDRSVSTAPGFESQSPTVSSSGEQEPPATQYQPSAFDKEETEYSHETTFETAVSSGFGEKKQIVSLPGGLTVSDAQCQAYAELEGRLRHGRQFGISFVAPIAANWLQSYSPIRRVDFTLDGTRTAYLIEAFNIQGDTQSCFVGGMGVEIGTVNADGTGTPSAAYSFT